MDGWIDDLRFYVLFNSISVISGRCLDDNERLCAKEFRLRLRRFRLEWGSNSVHEISRPALNPLSYWGSIILGDLIHFQERQLIHFQFCSPTFRGLV